MISDIGYFEITECVFTPRVVAVGETTTFSITIKNISGKNITSCYVRMNGYYPEDGGGRGSFPDIYLHGGPSFSMKPISWGNNVSQTFTGTYTFSEDSSAVDESYYVLPATQDSRIRIFIVTNATFSGGGNSDYFSDIRGSSGEYLVILSKRDNPRLSIDIGRTPNDEAETVKTSAKLNADTDLTALSVHGYTFSLHRSSAHDPATPEDTTTALNCTLAQMYAGITDSLTAVTETFSNGLDWAFLLVLTNGYETATANASIPRAFANVHLSGCSTGGVAFGKFSSSTEGNPIFECDYKTFFYKDVVFAGGVDGLPKIAVGKTNAVNVSSGSYTDVSVDCASAGFASAPIVLVSFVTASTSGNFGRCGVAVVPESITATGFTIRVFNGDSTARSPIVAWVAFGN